MSRSADIGALEAAKPVRHVARMSRIPPTLDMLPDGRFRTPPPPPGVPLSFKLMIGAVLVAVVAGAIAFAALALWVLSLILPVVIIAGAFAWVMVKVRRWQLLRGARNLRPL
jgi:hypothetical protein